MVARRKGEGAALDIIRGDQTNFICFDEVQWAWRVVDPILRRMDAGTRAHPYVRGRQLGTTGCEAPGRMRLPALAQPALRSADV